MSKIDTDTEFQVGDKVWHHFYNGGWSWVRGKIIAVNRDDHHLVRNGYGVYGAKSSSLVYRTQKHWWSR